jgi:hypothetical protein
MCPKVPRESISPLAGVVTKVTLKRFFPCVQLNVAEEVTFLSKRCPTLITLERAFTFRKDEKDFWLPGKWKSMHRLGPYGKRSSCGWFCPQWDHLGAAFPGTCKIYFGIFLTEKNELKSSARLF